jgi:hypothetical protein
MPFSRLGVAKGAVTLLLASSYAAAQILRENPSRIRGTIAAITDSSLTVRERNGSTLKLKTGPFTTYAIVVSSSLDEVTMSDFVGSAVKGPLGSMVALEVALIPENMRAGRVSMYGWDSLPDPTTGQTTSTRMINAFVVKVSLRPGTLTQTMQTHGSRAVGEVGSSGVTLAVTYEAGGKPFRIFVPSNAPIVRYIMSDRSKIAVGSDVMIKTDSRDRAGLVTIGNGVTPPM